jgi:predicted MFS family arabinose efflux permease
MIGDWALIAALPYEVYQRTGSALATGAVFVAGVAPAILFGSAAGVFVARYDRRRLMIWINVALAISLVPLFGVDVVGIWVIYAVLFVGNILEQAFIPAEVAMLPTLVGKEDLVAANSLSSLNRNLARLLGPAIGGAAIAFGGLTFVIVVDIASYVIAAVLIASIAPGASFRAAQVAADVVGDAVAIPASALRRLATEWRSGIRVITSQPMLRAMFVFAGMTAIGEGFLVALLVPWLTDILHGDELAWAAILSAQAVGGLIGALFVGRYLNKVAPAVLLGVGTLIFAVIDLAIFTYPLVLPIVLPAIIGMVIVGIPISAMGVGTTTLQQGLTTDSHRGRVVGTFQALWALGMVTGTLIAGVLSPTLGIIPMMALDSVIYFAGGVLILYTAGRVARRGETSGLAAPEGDPA